jgi:hypothetical protein
MPQQIINEDNLQRESFAELMKSVYTCSPGYILSFDPATQRAQVQIGIMRVDVDESRYAPPPVIDVPVSFPGDDWGVEYQIDPGCEGLIHFSQRCIDGWLNTGGIADNPIGRFHSIQDAFFVPGVRSIPNLISDFQNNGVRLRDKVGTQSVWLKNDGSIRAENPNVHVILNSDGSMNAGNAAGGSIVMATNGDVIINGFTFTRAGNITSAGNITTSGDVSAAGKSLSTHVHGGVEPGSGSTSAPT